MTHQEADNAIYVSGICLKTIAVSFLVSVSVLSGCEPARADGALNPAVTQENTRQTVCKPGWAASVRPSSSYSTRVKRANLDAFGIPRSQSRDYELDHIVPLSVGGCPRCLSNLALQPWVGKYGAHRKDRVENMVRRSVCSGRMTLDEGQDIFTAGKWRDMLDQIPEK